MSRKGWSGGRFGARAGVTASLAAAIAIALLSSAGASGATAATATTPPGLGAIEARALGPVRDTLIGPLDRRQRQATIAGEQTYPTGDGHHVRIEVDGGGIAEHPANPLAFSGQDRDQIARNFALFLGTRLHGDEIDSLHVFVTDDTGITANCGPNTFACYSPSDETMFAEPPSDQQPSPTDPNSKFVITHEYGHHVANNRRNTPWSGIDWGTKRWDSHERVCPGARSGRYHPGDEGAYYDENPGEAFAEAYAFRAYPSQIPWNIWDPALKPDQGAFDEIWRDVKKPWTGNARRTWRGSFARGDGPNKTRSFTTPLDGSATIRLTMPDSADYDLRILAAHSGKILATGIGDGPTREVAYYSVCGRRSFRAQVHRYIGRGGFVVRVSRP